MSKLCAFNESQKPNQSVRSPPTSASVVELKIIVLWQAWGGNGLPLNLGPTLFSPGYQGEGKPLYNVSKPSKMSAIRAEPSIIRVSLPPDSCSSQLSCFQLESSRVPLPPIFLPCQSCKYIESRPLLSLDPADGMIACQGQLNAAFK